MSDFLAKIGEQLLAFFIGVLTIVSIEWLKKPRIGISVREIALQTNVSPQRAYLQVNITNASIYRLFRPFVGRSAALNCHGVIEFQHLNGTPLFKRQMEGRWSSSIEVTDYVPHDRAFSLNLLNPLGFIDIHSNQTEAMAVAVRFEGESECYGFCNLSYFHQLKDPTWRMDEGVYKVQIILYFDGEMIVKKFQLNNRRDFADFRLTELSD